jgi:hypothetical protein
MKLHFLKHVLFGLAIVAGFSAAAMLLWNALVPGIFGLGAINFWQALGLLCLARLLFGGFGMFHGHHGRGWGKHSRNPMREKWERMTPEERKEFIHKRAEFTHKWHSSMHKRFGKHDFCEPGDFDTNEEAAENQK